MSDHDETILLDAAKSAWTDACRSTNPSIDEGVQKMHSDFIRRGSLRAASWAALTCGRQALRCADYSLARQYLLEAHGFFHFVDDIYGAGLVDAHLGAVLVNQGEFARALKFAKAPLAIPVAYSDLDSAILHNIAALCHLKIGEPHHAIAHLVSELNFVKNYNDHHRKSAVLANIGVLLMESNELELAGLASGRAWDIQVGCFEETEVDPAPLANLLLTNLYSGRTNAARSNAAVLSRLLDGRESTAEWIYRINLLDFYGAVGDYPNALRSYDRAKMTASRCDSPSPKLELAHAAASLHEAAREYQLAIGIARHVFENGSSHVSNVARIGVALLCSRCFGALRLPREASKWGERAKQVGHQGLLGEVLTSHLRTTLEAEVPLQKTRLTERERMCLTLSANGQTSTDIGLKLGIKPRTVNFHFSKILKKLNALNRQEAIAKAVRANLLPNPKN